MDIPIRRDRTATITTRLPSGQKAELERHTRRLAHRGTAATVNDLTRLAIGRFLRAARNGGAGWVAEQINEARKGDELPENSDLEQLNRNT